MLPPLKYYNVNWVDGMKLTRNHFLDQENAFVERMRDSLGIYLTSYNYGLLSPEPGSTNSLQHTADVDRATFLRVKVTQCRAITPSGARIEILANHPFKQNLVAEYNLSGSTHGKLLYIVISVN